MVIALAGCTSGFVKPVVSIVALVTLEAGYTNFTLAFSITIIEKKRKRNMNVLLNDSMKTNPQSFWYKKNLVPLISCPCTSAQRKCSDCIIKHKGHDFQ